MTSQPEKIQIMHVIHSLPADGAEQLLFDIIKRSNREIFQHSVACVVEGGPLVKELEDIGVAVYILHKRFKADISVIFKLVKLLQKRKIDILHSHMFTGYFWGTIAAVMARTPVNITTNHNTAYSKTKLQIIIEKIFTHFTDKIINISQEAYDSLAVLSKISPEKLELIPNGIDLDRFTNVTVEDVPFKKSLGLDPDKITIAMISRLFEQKGHVYFLDAMANLLRKRNNLQVLIVGDGELRDSLERKVHSLSPLHGNVIFTGVRRDVAAIMKVVDIFVLASLWEGLPIVLLEAMAMGKKILATKVGGIPEVLEDKVTGILVDSGNIAQIENGLMWILDHQTESENMARQAKHVAFEQYDVNVLLQKYESLYQDITEHERTKDLEITNPDVFLMVQMALYDLDRFRKFVFESNFLNYFEVEKGRIETIKRDDAELLVFGIEWVKFGLLGQQTFQVKKEVADRKKKELEKKGLLKQNLPDS